MSRIHEALRKAEREGKTTANADSQGRRNGLGEIKRALLAKGVSEREELESNAGAISPGKAKVAPVPPTIPTVQLKIQGGSKLVTHLDPKSIPSEQYRALKTKVFQLYQAQGFKTLLVTSAGMSEGKSITAANLALTMAQEINFKVLLVDGDLRRPNVHRLLGVEATLGLSDYLSEKCPLEGVVYRSQFENFSLVPAGFVPENPAELLNSSRMRSFMTNVSERFDWIVVDSPPIATLSDSDILAAMTDGVLVVVRALQTPMDLLEKAMEALKGRNILGIVLNGHEDDKTKRYSYYYYRDEGGKSPL